MKGRLENEIKKKQCIQVLLKELPKYVSDFYYVIQVSLEATTCLEYLRRIKNFYDYCGTTDLNKIDEVVISRYFEKLSYCIDRNGTVEKTSFSHRKTTWTALNRLFAYLQEKGMIAKNPITLVQRVNKQDDVKQRYLSMNDLNKIVGSVQKATYDESYKLRKYREEMWMARDLLIVSLFICTGMRCTALTEINVEDVSFETGKITVIDKRNTLIKYDITPELHYLICDWLERREEILGEAKCDALFISNRKQRINDETVRTLIKRYSSIALEKGISPHKIRSAFVTLYYKESGNDIEATRQAVGHASIATTRRYIATENNARKDAASFMSGNINIAINRKG